MKWSMAFILIILIILLSNFIMAMKAQAVDLGVWGESFAIMEEDFEVHIMKQLEALGEDKIEATQELIKDKMVANIKRPRAVKGINRAVENKSRLYDPTFTLAEDIHDEKGHLLYSSGTKINPLEKKAFDEVWVLIDGDDQAQVDFAKKYQEDQYPTNGSAVVKGKKNGDSNENESNQIEIEKTGKIGRIKKIILLKGAPGVQKDGSFFFFDQMSEISRKLNISKVPSVIRQAPDGINILIDEVALEENDLDLEANKERANTKSKSISGGIREFQ